MALFVSLATIETERFFLTISESCGTVLPFHVIITAIARSSSPESYFALTKHAATQR